MKTPELSIVIPFYDEERTVEQLTKALIKEFRKSKINYELVLVNNGSSDSTPKIVDKLAKKYKRIKAVHVKVNQGYGFGILNGLRVTKGDYVGYIDGDFEVLPKDVIKVYKKIRSTNADVGKGIRAAKESGIIKSASFGYDLLFFILYFRFIKQVNAKPKIMRKDCYKKMNLKSKDWFLGTEILIKSIKYNYKIVSQKVSYKQRKTGKSHVDFLTILEFFKNIIKARFIGV